MTRANEFRERLASDGYKVLFKGHTLVACQHRIASSDEAIAIADGGGDVRDLEPPGFALANRAAEQPKCFEEEALDEMRLKTARLGPFHLFADFAHLRCVHRVVRQRSFLDQLLDVLAVQGVVDLLRHLRAHFGALAITDCLDHQIAQRSIAELELAEHVEHLAAKRLAFALELFKDSGEDFALAGLLRDEVPEVADFGLPDAVNPAEALLEAVGVPRQIVIDGQMGALEVDAFAGGVGGNENLDLLVLGEGLLSLSPFLAAHRAMNLDECFGTADQRANFFGEII